MTFAKVWDTAVALMAAVGVLAAFAGAAYKLLTLTKKYKGWRRKREQREEALDRLAQQAEHIECSVLVRREHSKDMEDFRAFMEEIAESDRRQNGYIQDSLKERQLSTQATLALLDWAIVQGANGTAHAARDALRAYQAELSHRY